jgi:deoxyribonuclease (pyrimidine dimer)
MVRVNLIHPKKLTDQHLIAEYNEILMLLGYVAKYPKKEGIPKEYVLGKGHIKFFKDKLLYLIERHEHIKQEMQNRTFKVTKTIDLTRFPQELHNNWKPKKKDIAIITDRISKKLKKRPNWYRYYGENKSLVFFIELLK